VVKEAVVFGRGAAVAELALIDGISGIVAASRAAGRSPHPHFRRRPDLQILRDRQPGTTRQALDLPARLSVRPPTSIPGPRPGGGSPGETVCPYRRHQVAQNMVSVGSGKAVAAARQRRGAAPGSCCR